MNEEIRRDRLCGKWMHSHEEDTDTEMVFRPANYPFPPSRGRRSFDLEPDGRLVERAIGPADRGRESVGRWRLERDDLTFLAGATSPAGAAGATGAAGAAGAAPDPDRVLRLVSVAKDKLVVRKEA